jgi:Ion channel
MLRQIAFGGGVSLVNIAIHAFTMTTLIVVSQFAYTKAVSWFHASMLFVLVMVPTVLFLMVVHFFEVSIWALAYLVVDAAPVGADRLDFAFVNYTTLGYGDVVPVANWRLLGPITAMNGMLLFGWSTAAIFEVLRRSADKVRLYRNY